jgi:ferredoxin-nitrite reductase
MPAKPNLTGVEQDKLNIHPDFDFKELALKNWAEFPPNVVAMFKWSGIYMQLQKGFFMIRLRIPGGIFTAPQLARAGELAALYGQDQLCITTRQCLQFHWVRLPDLHKIIDGMKEVGILAINACGDVTRNVVSCPMIDVCPHELGNTRKVLHGIADNEEIVFEQRNLPRKHKISVAGCGRACGQTLMNCQGWYAVTRQTADGQTEVGWKFHAGGGLGARPILAKAIFDWVPEDMVTAVARATTEVYRRHGDRRKRHYSRLKVVVERMGQRAFAEEVIAVMQERHEPGTERLVFSDGPATVAPSFLDGQAVIPQKQAGFNTIRVMIHRSEFSGDEARRFADWATQYGDGSVIFTNRQNLQLRFIPDANVPTLVAAIKAAGYRMDGFERLPDTVACVGTTVCNLAVGDTPNTYRQILSDLAGDEAWWQSIGPLRINMNGCPNSCGQHAIADIGLRGTRTREEVGSEEGYGIFVGGSLQDAGHVAEYVCDVDTSDAVRVLRRLLDIYLAERQSPSEEFGAWSRKIGGKALGEKLLQPLAGKEPLALRNLILDPLYHEVVLENWFKDRGSSASGLAEE